MTEVERKLWNKADRYGKLLRFVPFLRFAGVCNSLSFGLVDEKSDIDIFIIAKKGRLFFVRTIVTLLFHVLGVRRHGKKIAGRFCLSFFIDDSELCLSSLAIERDIYLAFWVRKMAPLVNDGVFTDFVASNSRLLAYFDAPILMSDRDFKSSYTGIFSSIFAGGFGNFLEVILMKWQIKRAALKMNLLDDRSGLIVSEHILKFHNIDRRRSYSLKWFDKYGSSKITDEKFSSILERV